MRSVDEDFDDDGFDVGDLVYILWSGCVGYVTDYKFRYEQEDRYRVAYVDTHGSPQCRWWRVSHLGLAEATPTGADEVEATRRVTADVMQFPNFARHAHFAQ
ncbi:MAG: hypothetical protein ACAH27_05960 [Xanthobacteraceae bacterium]